MKRAIYGGGYMIFPKHGIPEIETDILTNWGAIGRF
jgi:hypothetical protein